MSTGSIGGIGGMDIGTIVNALLEVERQPLGRIQSEIAGEQSKLFSWSNVQNKIAAMQSKAEQLTSASLWTQRTVSVNQSETVMSASADTTAANGSYDVIVTQMAKADRYFTNAVADPDDIGNAAGSFMINGQTIDLDANTSLQNLVDKINTAADDMAADNKVKASLVGEHLVMESVSTGTDAIISVTDTDGILTGLGLFDNYTAGSNLEMTINGVPVNRQNNSGLSDVIAGVTLSFQKEGSASFTVERDKASIKSVIEGFVSAYNDAMSTVKRETAVNLSDSGKMLSTGTLQGDSLLRDMSSRFRQMVMATAVEDPDISPEFNALWKVGISISGTDNQLSINSTTLNSVLDNNLEELEDLIRDPEAGLVNKFNTYLKSVSNPTEGSIKLRQNTINQGISRRNDSIASLNRYLLHHEEALWQQYAHLQSVLNDMNGQLNWVRSLGVTPMFG